MSIIELKNIEKSYEDSILFNKFSLIIEEKEMVALTGQSGAGKSTLLNIIGLLERFDNGDYVLCGEKNIKPNTSKSSKLIRDNIGYIFQNFALIENETVEYNLNIALKYVKLSTKRKKELIWQTLKTVNLTSKFKEKVFKLSGGEQQRIAIARVILKPSKIILADEPTGSLDQKNRDIIMDLIENLNDAGKTVIIASHDTSVINRCKRIIEL